MSISVEFKEQLGNLIAEGHKAFGHVAPRKPYRKDDGTDSGAGAAELLFESHPLLAEQPIGAPSDLTAIVTANSDALEEAEKRSNELSYQLRQSLQKRLTHAAAPAMNPLG